MHFPRAKGAVVWFSLPIVIHCKYCKSFLPLESPPPGEKPPQAAEGVHFPRAKGAVVWFFLPTDIHCKYCKSFLPLKSPPPGEKPPQAAEGVHFLVPKARLYGFSRPQGGLPVFLRAKPGC